MDIKNNSKMDDCIIVKCMAIANTCFINSLYQNDDILERYKIDGVANKGSCISHYCNLNVLKSIIDNGSLRFSDVRFLNDSTEFMDIIGRMENILKLNEENYEKPFIDLILKSEEFCKLKEDYKQSSIEFSKSNNAYKKDNYYMYTCSFSMDEDSLIMWNYYADSTTGVNIVFNHFWEMFKEISNMKGSSDYEKTESDIVIFFGHVLYDNECKERCLKNLFDALYRVYIEAKVYEEKYHGDILYALKKAVNNTRIFFKHHKFRDEREYRIALKIPERIIKSDRNENGIKDKGFFSRGNVLIPYVDYEFQKESIKSIILNPYGGNKNDLFELGIKEFLYIEHLEGVKVYQSNIPIRKYD